MVADDLRQGIAQVCVGVAALHVQVQRDEPVLARGQELKLAQKRGFADAPVAHQPVCPCAVLEERGEEFLPAIEFPAGDEGSDDIRVAHDSLAVL